jgi:GT2 family glycosyltransferase
MVRAETARDVGFFDEGFGLGYFEEVDYQLRARRNGWTSLVAPRSAIVHASARAFDQHPKGFKEELLRRNWLRVMTIHWPAHRLLMRLPLELIRSLRDVSGGSDPGPTVRAWRGWLQMFPELIARRKEVRRRGVPVDFSVLGRWKHREHREHPEHPAHTAQRSRSVKNGADTATRVL